VRGQNATNKPSAPLPGMTWPELDEASTTFQEYSKGT
jgi:hypothetical protein